MLDIMNQICRYARIIPAIEDNQSSSFFWVLYFFAISVIIIIILSFIYMIYSISKNSFYFVWPIILLKELLTLIYWILFNPFMEAFMSMFKCDNGMNKIVTSLNCFSGIHIFYILLSLFFIIFLCLIALLALFFYSDSQPIQRDVSARIDDNSQLLLLCFRFIIVIYSTFDFGVF